MKYKVGDKVQIKSIDWYNENKDADGFVHCVDKVFDNYMSVFCGSVVTIGGVYPDNRYDIREDMHCRTWTDDMIEGLVERNGKTYPYKIGDRVILKGNNRCATITDLKYNSFGNLSYYIKIDNDKDISTDCPTDLLLPYDNMIEGIVEGETKFGTASNPIKIKSNSNTIYLTQEKVDELVTKIDKDLSSENQNVWELPDGYQFIDENGSVINATKIVLEKKKPKYPKTYEECCKVLNWNPRNYEEYCRALNWNPRNYDRIGYKFNLICKLQVLLLCRDAYWKIAGEELGLGKPWEPNWKDFSEDTYPTITKCNNRILKTSIYTHDCILTFPTAEIRDAFYENFKELIETCKELL